MRKDLKGRPPRIPNVKERIKELREKNLSYTEIGLLLGISRQLAQWHGKRIEKEGGLTSK